MTGSRATRWVLGAVWIIALGLPVESVAQEATGQSTKPEFFQVRPGVRFLTPTSAEFRWESTIPGPSVVAYGTTRKLGSVAASDSSGSYHRVVLENLQPGQDYWYRFGVRRGNQRSFSEVYRLEGAMNYTPARLPSVDPLDESFAVIDRLDQLGGYAVVTDAVDSRWAESIAAQSTMTVTYAVGEGASMRPLRERWYEEAKYGVRLSVQRRSILPASFANVVVTDNAQLDDSLRLLNPRGRIVVVGAEPDHEAFAWSRMDRGVFLGERREPAELAAWGHQYGSVSNTSYSGERLGGVDKTSDLKVKWIGKPGADFGIDRNPRMPAPLAVGGRLFHQGMNRMIALDAFNGAVLWSLEIPDLRRVNIPRDSANWCADDLHVYAAVNDALWVIDASNGEMKKTMSLPESMQAKHEWGYVAVTSERIIGTAVKKGSSYSNFWDKASWYDGKDDAATAKVCGDAIVAYDKKYGNIDWEHSADAVVHSTITIHGDHVYFVQVDDPTLKNSDTGKLTNDRIWSNASVVCLDLQTGKQLWRSKVLPQDHECIISFGIADEKQFVLQTSGKNQFHFASFDGETGSMRWQRSANWPEDHHGAHVQHAVLMNGKLLVQPHILDAADGRLLQSGTLGKRRGCATPVGAGNSIIYRGGTGPVTLWSLDSDTTSEFTRLRPSCWLSTIPAQGMLFSPEGGGGCSCGGWMETSIGFAPTVTVER
ncbi:MAG: PQQ-binding-like beta-propeller repeat protein [Planctomycetota bacterium]